MKRCLMLPHKKEINPWAFLKMSTVKKLLIQLYSVGRKEQISIKGLSMFITVMFVSRSFRCTDRSAAKCVESIFFKRKVPNENSCWKVTDCLKTAQTGSNRITAEQLKNEGALDKLIHAKEGYRFIASIDPFILPRVQNSWLSAQSAINCNANG